MCVFGIEGSSSCSYAEISRHEGAWDRRNRSTHSERGHCLEQIVPLHDQDSLPPEKDHALGSQLGGLLWTQRGGTTCCTHCESSNAGRLVRNLITILSELSLLLCMMKVHQRILAGSVCGCEYVCDHWSLVKLTQFCPISGVGVRDVLPWSYVITHVGYVFIWLLR
jgi:hypothetical protein